MTKAVPLSIILAAMLFTLPSQAQSPGPQASTSKGTRLVLLGTAGGPSIKKSRAQPANALIVNGSVYIIDAGNGVARQMALANVSPQALRAVFITHLHSDHTADYGTLLLRAWLTGLKTPVDTYGPSPLEEMTKAYMRYMDWDIQLRISDENRQPFAPMVRAHDIRADGVIFQDENVKVTAVEVPHGAAKPSYAFRFDTPTRSIVFSGDTSRSDSLVKLAKGADILVHEVLNPEGVDAAVGIAGVANEALKRHIIEAHTPIEETGQVARDAGVKKLVLTHFVPSLPAFDKPEIWLRGARKFYGGEIVVGQDLLEIE
jgi:ribonuclease BN (tRNA processing enzyme)